MPGTLYSAVFLLLLLLIPPCYADHKPLWELGGGAAMMNIPDYPGSDESANYAVIYPYLVYRGDRFQVNREGIKGRLFDRNRISLDLSVGASIPVQSSENNARAGMDDLDPLLELGPLLKLRLNLDPDSRGDWELNFPIRAAYSIDLSDFRHRGWLFNPHLAYENYFHLNDQPVDWRLAVGLLLADKTYNDHVFGVANKFATAERTAYAGSGGYSGTRILATFSQRINRNWLIGGFFRYDDLRGTVIEDSPLVKQDQSLMAGFALTWIFRQSEETANH